MTTSSARARPPAWRIAVAGGGALGLALSVALRRSLGEAVAVEVCDPALAALRTDGRAYALSAETARFLQELGIWEHIRERVQPIGRMLITDSRTGDAVRPTYLDFNGQEEALGFMIEAAALAPALLAACQESGVGLRPASCLSYAAEGTGVAIQLSTGERLRASLLVAADGGRSRLRELAGIAWFGRTYPQTGIVATVAHERDHRGLAVQHFLPAGPFAILPLAVEDGRHRSSIVWTERAEEARRVLALTPEAALAEVESRFGPELGRVALETELSGHPLRVGLARHFAAGRIALVGDAAHEIHPLAGQGLNLGFADVAALSRRIVEAARLGLDPGGPDVLAAYERDRRFDAVALAAVTDGLNRLFSNDVLPARVLRDIGLGLVDRRPGLKRALAARAAGSTARPPLS